MVKKNVKKFNKVVEWVCDDPDLYRVGYYAFMFFMGITIIMSFTKIWWITPVLLFPVLLIFGLTSIFTIKRKVYFVEAS